MSDHGSLASLRQRLPLVAPSMLKCDFGNLARDVQRLEQAGAELLHWDVMDGRFVPNLSYGAMVIAALAQRTDLASEAHLMIEDADRYLDEYVQAGCDWITIHIEAGKDPRGTLRRIRAAGCWAGLALNPGTPAERLRPYLEDVDSVLVMSVEPGFGGQRFIPSSLEKLQEVRGLVGPDKLVAIDGGIGPETIAACAAAGADVFVAGSAIFDRPDFRPALDELSALARESHRGR
ncbi:MAG: ribulose-phosphate 3-epimerase [Planctomyces sp.]|nr:ribulose-phosphate 3-epimerase [Planctomyces sp.]